MNFSERKILEDVEVQCFDNRPDDAIRVVIPSPIRKECCNAHHCSQDKNFGHIFNPKMRNILSFLNLTRNRRTRLVSDEYLYIRDDNNLGDVDPYRLLDEMNKAKVDFIHQMPLIYVDSSENFLSSNMIDSHYMNIVHARIYIVSHILGILCCTGKSTLMKGKHIEEFVDLSNYILEDNMIASLYQSRTLSSRPIYHTIDSGNVFGYLQRRIRWSVNRKFTLPWSFYLEIITELYFVNLIILLNHSRFIVLLNTLSWIALDQLTYIRTTGRNINLVSWLVREISSPLIFIYALFQDSVLWKGKRLRINDDGQIQF